MEMVSAMRNVVGMGLAQKDSGKLVRLWRDLVGPEARLGSHGVVQSQKTTLNPLTPEEAGWEWKGTVPLYSQCCAHSPSPHTDLIISSHFQVLTHCQLCAYVFVCISLTLF